MQLLRSNANVGLGCVAQSELAIASPTQCSACPDPMLPAYAQRSRSARCSPTPAPSAGPAGTKIRMSRSPFAQGPCSAAAAARPPCLCTPAQPQARGPASAVVRAGAGSAAPAGSGCAGTGCRSRPCFPRRAGPASRSAPRHTPAPCRTRGLHRATHQRATKRIWRDSVAHAQAPFALSRIICGCALCMTTRRCRHANAKLHGTRAARRRRAALLRMHTAHQLCGCKEACVALGLGVGAHNDVRKLPRGQDPLLERRLDCALVLREHRQHVPAALRDVAAHPVRGAARGYRLGAMPEACP